MIVISPFCIGLGALSNFIALMLSVPGVEFRSRLKGFGRGLPIISLSNFIKIPLEGLISYHNASAPWINQIDTFFAACVLIIVYITWSQWVMTTLKSDFSLILKTDLDLAESTHH